MIEPRSKRVRSAFGALRRRSGAGIAFFVLVVAVVAGGTYFVQPVYRARAVILVEGRDPTWDITRFAAIEQALGRSKSRSDAGSTGQSAEMARDGDGGTHADDAAGRGSGRVPDRAIDRTIAGRAPLPGAPDPLRVARNELGHLTSRPLLERMLAEARVEDWPEYVDSTREEIFAALRERIRLREDPSRDLVEVELEGWEPEKIAAGLNRLLELFADAQAAQFEEPAEWVELRRQENAVRAELDEIAGQLERLNEQRGSWILEQDLAEVEVSLRALRREWIAARAERRDLERTRDAVAAADGGGQPLEIRFGILDDAGALAELRELRAERARLDRELSTLLSRGGYRVSHRQAIEAGQAETDSAIEALEGRVMALLERRLSIARLAEQELKGRLAAAEAPAKQLRARLDAVHQLVDRQRHLRDQRDDLQSRKSETWLARASSPPTARVQLVDPAGVPTVPIRPRPVQNLLVAIGVGLLGGILLVFVLELLDDSIKGSRDIRTVLRLPSLGTIPKLGGRNAADRVKLITVEQPGSDVSEAFRGICSGMNRMRAVRERKGGRSRLGGRGGAVEATGGLRAIPEDQVLVVTSAGRGEGKTTTASNLAVSMAQMGQTTLLMDANVRDPKVHQIFHVPNDRGLSTLVAAGEPIDRCVRKSGVPNLSVLPSGPSPVNPADIFLGSDLERAIEQLRGRYQRIVIDAPSILCGNDVVVLGRVADAALMVVGAYQTSREEVVAGKEYLTSVGVTVAGAILNRIRGERGDSFETESVEPPVTAS